MSSFRSILKMAGLNINTYMPFWMCFMKSELIFKIRDCYYLKFVCVGVLDMVLSMSLFFSSTPNFDSYRHIYNSPIGRLHLLDRLIFEYSKYDGFRWARNRNRTDKIYTYYIFEGSSWASHEFFCLLGQSRRSLTRTQYSSIELKNLQFVRPILSHTFLW